MCDCNQGSPCGGGGSADSAVPGGAVSSAGRALVTAEVNYREPPQPGAVGQGQQWVLARPHAFVSGTVRSGQA